MNPSAAPAKDFLSVLDLSSRDLIRLIDLAAQMKAERHLADQAPTAHALRGRHVAMLFEKPSLRTRSTFEIAVRELGGHTLQLPEQFAGGEREPLEDIARNLERWVKALVVRTYEHTNVTTLAAAAPMLHVINALSDEEHPCQALADMLTLRERWDVSSRRTIAYVGDGNNVATSLAHAAPQLGISVHLASPLGYEVPARVIEDATRGARDGAHVRVFGDPREAVSGADAVLYRRLGLNGTGTGSRRAPARVWSLPGRQHADGGRGSRRALHALPARASWRRGRGRCL